MILACVSNIVERMARTDYLELAATAHDNLELLDGFGVMHAGGVVGDIAGPIRLGWRHLGLLLKVDLFLGAWLKSITQRRKARQLA